MLKRKYLLLLSILMASLFFLPRVVLAQEPGEDALETKNIVVEESEVINRDFFAAGETITISGEINGDAFLAGGNISVDGKVNGDLLAGGGMITISGEVTDDVRVGGGNILISGTIGKNLTVGGGNVILTKEAKVQGSLLAFSGSITINSPIGRNAQVFAGQAILDNQIGGDLKGAIESLTLSSGAQILGNLEYESSQKATIAKGATVSGQIAYKPREKKAVPAGALVKKFPFQIGKRISPFFALTGFLFNLILGFIFISFFPKRTAGIVKTLGSRPWASLGVGFITPILFGLLMVLLVVSLIGLPLALFLIPLFIFLVYFSKVFTALFIGEKLLKRSRAGNLLAGLLVYSLLQWVSPAGLRGIFSFTFTFFGLGAFVLDQKSFRQKPIKKVKASRKP